MSLDSDISGIKNYEELRQKDGCLIPLTRALILNCMAIQMGGITEKNWN